jgi:hypothetical protein
MNKKILFFIVGILFLANFALIAQEEDSTDSKWYEFGNKDWYKLDWKFRGKPFIELNYGLSSLKLNNLKSSLADVGLVEIKLGYATQDHFEGSVIRFSEKFMYTSKLSANFKSGSVSFPDMKSITYRFGLGRRSGFGYKSSSISILPYNSSGLLWSRIDMVDYPAEDMVYNKSQFWETAKLTLQEAREDTDLLNRYHNTFRFGSVNEGGLRIEYLKTFSINAGYESALVFPRHMVWKYLGSAIIEEIGMGLLDRFVDEIADTSPQITPVINFLLKNGFAYLFDSLRKDKMNWPFDTEAPLRYETFKFGITWTF